MPHCTNLVLYFLKKVQHTSAIVLLFSLFSVTKQSLKIVFTLKILYFTTWKSLSDDRRLYLHAKNDTKDLMMMD